MSGNTKWLLAGIIFTLLTVAFLALFALPYRIPAEQAIANGARVEINLKTGEVKQADAKKPEEEKTAEPEKSAEEEKTDQEIKTPEADKPAEEGKLKPSPASEAEKIMPEEVKPAPAEAAPTPAIPETKEAPPPVATEPAAPAAAPVAPAAEAPKVPHVAIIVIGAGLSRSSTEQIMRLPETISFSFSPYASEMGQWVKIAQQAKREIYLDLPLEPKDYPYTDPGPYALLTGLDELKNKERLNEVLKRGVDFKGLVAGPDERFTESGRSQEWLLNTIKGKKLTFAFVSRPSNHQFMQQAEKSGLSVLGIDTVIDEKLTTEAIDAALLDVESLAQKSGFAVALARPYPISVLRMEAWIKTLADKGITLVPLSQLKPIEKPAEKKPEAGDLHDGH